MLADIVLFIACFCAMFVFFLVLEIVARLVTKE